MVPQGLLDGRTKLGSLTGDHARRFWSPCFGFCQRRYRLHTQGVRAKSAKLTQCGSHSTEVLTGSNSLTPFHTARSNPGRVKPGRVIRIEMSNAGISFTAESASH